MAEKPGCAGRGRGAAALGWGMVAAGALAAAVAAAVEEKPWVTPVSLRVDAVETVLTPGDRASRYAFEGSLSGLRVLPGGKEEVRLLLAHDRRASDGAPRSHGAKGAFLSEWRLGVHRDAQGLTLYPRSGRDLLKRVGAKRGGESGALDGVCAPAAASPDGEALLFGERRGGRVFRLAKGEALSLPDLGRWPREGCVLLGGNPGSPALLSLGGDLAGAGGRVFLFVPSKGASLADEGPPPAGRLFVLQMEDENTESALRAKGKRTRFRWLPLQTPPGGVESPDSFPGTAFSSPRAAVLEGAAGGGLYLLTAGDDRRGPSGRYLDHNGRLFRLAFDDPSDPSRGGTMEVLLAGTEGPAGLSCLAPLPDGSLLLGEAPAFPLPGREASLWRFDPRSGDLARLLEVNPAAAGAPEEAGEWGIAGVADGSGLLGGGWIFVAVRGPAFSGAAGRSQVLAVHVQ